MVWRSAGQWFYHRLPCMSTMSLCSLWFSIKINRINSSNEHWMQIQIEYYCNVKVCFVKEKNACLKTGAGRCKYVHNFPSSIKVYIHISVCSNLFLFKNLLMVSRCIKTLHNFNFCHFFFLYFSILTFTYITFKLHFPPTSLHVNSKHDNKKLK